MMYYSATKTIWFNASANYMKIFQSFAVIKFT